jgi:hypothetical protein
MTATVLRLQAGRAANVVVAGAALSDGFVVSVEVPGLTADSPAEFEPVYRNQQPLILRPGHTNPLRFDGPGAWRFDPDGVVPPEARVLVLDEWDAHE